MTVRIARILARNRLSYLALVLTCVTSITSFAKGATTKITIENPGFASPIEITDPNVAKNFQVFAGPGTHVFGGPATGGNESRSFIMDWTTGGIKPPVGLESYRVSFHLAEYPHPYVVTYAFDRSNEQGYVYLPGKGDEDYRNVSIIFRHVEGQWFRALSTWNDIARPLIEAKLLVGAAQRESSSTPDPLLSGIWNGWNPTPRDALPQGWPISLHTGVPTTFLIFSDGKKFGGKAIVDNHPGYGDLIDGQIDGDNLSFTVVAHARVNDQPVDYTIYYTGKIHGDDMDLVMRWPSSYGPNPKPSFELKMKAKKFHHD